MASNYPPGVTGRMIDELFAEGPCEMCGNDVDNCICPACHHCGTIGDPYCYSKHGLMVGQDQIDALVKRLDHERELYLQEQAYLNEMEKEYSKSYPDSILD